MQGAIGKGKRRILIQRHVESVYNLEQKKFRIEHGFPVDAMLPENNFVKYKLDPELQDANITTLGLKQCQEAAKLLEKYQDIHFVLASPLRMCIKTFDNTFRNYDRTKLKEIKAMELLAERLDSCCDIPDKTRKLREEFKEIDFSFMDKFPIPDIWFVHNMPERHKWEMYQVGKAFGSNGGNNQLALEVVTKAISHRLERLLPVCFEDFKDLQVRIMYAKRAVADYIIEKEEELGRPLLPCELYICGHSSINEAFTSTVYDQKTGRGKNGIWMKNGDIVEFELDLDTFKSCEKLGDDFYKIPVPPCFNKPKI